MKWSEVQCREREKNETLWENFLWTVKCWRVRAGVKAWVQYVWGKKILETIYSTFIPWCFLPFVHVVFYVVLCVLLLVVLCVLLSYYVYMLYYVCIGVFTFDAGLLARSQYSEGPATGYLDWGFSWFPCVYKQMLRWFPRFQIATTCFSCSPPDLNLLVTKSYFLYM